MEGFRFGPVLTDKVISVVKRVEDTPYIYGNASVPVRFEEDGGGGGGGGGEVRLGKTTAAWDKGTLATITLYEKGSPPNETANDESPYTLEGCVNKFANVDGDKWVIVALATNGRWYLISAECG